LRGRRLPTENATSFPTNASIPFGRKYGGRVASTPADPDLKCSSVISAGDGRNALSRQPRQRSSPNDCSPTRTRQLAETASASKRALLSGHTSGLKTTEEFFVCMLDGRVSRVGFVKVLDEIFCRNFYPDTKTWSAVRPASQACTVPDPGLAFHQPRAPFVDVGH
jgi:hypothetical protein